MEQYNYTVKYKPGALNTDVDALSRRPDYHKALQKPVQFAYQLGLPLCTVHQVDNIQNTAFIEIVEQRRRDIESSSTEYSTRSTEISTEIQVEGTNCKVYSDNQDRFRKLKKGVDKLLVHSTRLGNISGCVCGEHAKQVRCTTGNEGHHPSPNSGVLRSIVIEFGWIVSIAEAQQTATELKKCKDLADSVENVEFGYRTVEDCKVLYRLKGEGTQLVLPNNGGFRQLILEELHASKLAGHLGVRKTLIALKQRVWWPGMIQTVTKFVKACPVCQQVNNLI